ncbi:MAG TPA: hypothetical protein VK668_03430 [Mucilaginibacter sp.]|nr:hypothetical protein [Mucilaginibacter sp.]
MKRTTKMMTIAVAAVGILFASNVKAQTVDANKFRLGIGVEAGIPTGGESHVASNFELGGTARLQYGASNNLAITLTSGYYNFFPDQALKDAGGSSAGIIPVKAGVKAFFSQNLYFGGEAGAGFETNGLKDVKLLLTPGIGWASKSWDVGARYENFSGQGNSFGLVGLRVAYGFAL